jgi:NAD-dependent SIR2 family protein deacetylase
MASNTLRRRRITEEEVTDKCAYCYRKHDPAVVCHEEQPIPSVLRPDNFVVVHSHDEERVKHLHSVEQALDDLDLLLVALSSVSPWAK